jgi:hypothetical protein
MKKNALINLTVITTFSLLSTLLKANTDIPIEIRGLVNLNENYMFSVHDIKTNQSKWIRKGQVFKGFKVTDYDSTNFMVVGFYLNSKVRLALAESELELIFNSAVMDEEKQNTYSLAEIDYLVNNFRKNEFAKLPDENEPLFYILKQSAENRIASYKNSLISFNRDELPENVEPSIEDKTIPLNNKPRIGSQRKMNNVNSRIWASDHVEEFGLPNI